MISDEALMVEFQGGSRAAFEELFARYHKPLYGFFGRRLNNPERAEDLAQETFLAVIRAASRYEPRALVRTYLYGIALKLLAAERRKFSTRSTLGRSAPEPKTELPVLTLGIDIAQPLYEPCQVPFTASNCAPNSPRLHINFSPKL